MNKRLELKDEEGEGEKKVYLEGKRKGNAILM